MKMGKNFAIFTVILVLNVQGCSWWESFRGEESVSAEGSPKEGASQEVSDQKAYQTKSQTQLADERELKLARLWARVDEIEDDQKKILQKMKLLERGLTLGIIPDELKNDGMSDAKSKDPADEFGKLKQTSGAKSLDLKVPVPPSQSTLTAPLSANEEKAYQDALAAAHEQFRAGRYGRAIVEFDTIGKSWGQRIPGGAYLYWIGKSWIQLKEYQLARKVLGEFLASFARSPWVPRAQLELARIEWKTGQNETAIAKYREIIRDYPYEDAAEMAKMELSQVDKAL